MTSTVDAYRHRRRRLRRSHAVLVVFALLAAVVAAEDTPAPIATRDEPPPVVPPTTAPATPPPSSAAPVTTAPPATTQPPATTAPPVTPVPTTEAPKTTAPAPTTVKPTPAVKSSSESHSKSSTGSSSRSGSRDAPTPAPKTTKPPTSRSPTKAPKTAVPTPPPQPLDPSTPVPRYGSRGGGSRGSDSNNQRDRGDDQQSKTLVILVVAGIAGVCVLGLVVMCLLRRRRADYDDFISPLPRYAAQPPNSATHGSGSDLSAPGVDNVAATGPGAANYYGKSSKLSVDTGLADMQDASVGITSPGLPNGYRPSNRQSRLASVRSSTALSQSGIGADRLRQTNHSELSNFSITGESEPRYGSEYSHDASSDRPSFNSRISSQSSFVSQPLAGSMYRFSKTSSVSSLHDTSPQTAAVTPRSRLTLTLTASAT
ncbi:hypothetical protein PINS_up009378 [Pythium insidiosum]|nr:hypothetical protein PINS_up009378 [Pythium insidiosum]